VNFLRNHWYDAGGILGLIILTFLFIFLPEMSNYRLLMWLSWVALLFHQVEEYRLPGTFPGMVNKVMFKSDLPDRFPLNSNTSLIINVGLAWTVYLLAAVTGERYVWLGMATMLVSLGNIIAHTFIFNIKGKMICNAGLATSWLCFAPCVFFFFKIIHQESLVSVTDYLIGVPLGIGINIFGVFKLILWLADRNTRFTFSTRQLLPIDRND